jgi:DNA repair protein RadC
MQARELRVVYSRGKPCDPPLYLGKPADAAALLTKRLERESVEVCCVVLLNTRHQVLAVHELSRGSLDSTSVHPRELFKVAILGNAAAVIVAHYVTRHIMAIMWRRSLCDHGNGEPPIAGIGT